MNREEVYRDMEDKLGVVLSMFEKVPDESIGLEWELMQAVQMKPGPIPNKYRELIGIGIASATKCPYCVFFHTEMAKLNGATDEEIEDAVHFAKSSMGWSTYLHGMQIDFERFKEDVLNVVQHIRTQAPEGMEWAEDTCCIPT